MIVKSYGLVMMSALAFVLSAPVVTAQSSAPKEDMEMARQFMQTAQAFVQSAIGGSGNVFVTVDGDTATLIGFVDSIVTKNKAEMAARMDMRVSKVRNHIVTSS